MAHQKLYFHVSYLKEFRHHDQARIKSGRMDNPSSILIDNVEQWEGQHILDYYCQNNRHKFLVYWKAYERRDNSSEPIENLDHSLELIREYWDANHTAESRPLMTCHIIKASSEPMAVSSTPRTVTDCPDDFWEPYDLEKYDSMSTEQDYFATEDDSLLGHTDDSGENSEDIGMMVYLSE